MAEEEHDYVIINNVDAVADLPPCKRVQILR